MSWQFTRNHSDENDYAIRYILFSIFSHIRDWIVKAVLEISVFQHASSMSKYQYIHLNKNNVWKQLKRQISINIELNFIFRYATWLIYIIISKHIKK